MIVDGKKIAADILRDLTEGIRRLEKKPVLMVIACDPNFETRRFMDIKKKKAEEVGIELVVSELPADIKEEDAVEVVAKAAHRSDGIVVQLPFPQHIDKDKLIAAIPASHDVDAFSFEDEDILPPVVGAVREILERHAVEVAGKRAVVVGSGKLVGLPTARWLKQKGAAVRVAAEAADIAHEVEDADIIVLGAGSPGLLGPEMVREGVVILDAGTSEEGGKLRGDADPRCAEKAALFTPVPGGIGPITVAVLLRNLVTLVSRRL